MFDKAIIGLGSLGLMLVPSLAQAADVVTPPAAPPKAEGSLYLQCDGNPNHMSAGVRCSAGDIAAARSEAQSAGLAHRSRITYPTVSNDGGWVREHGGRRV